jgi:hypothetical protein
MSNGKGAENAARAGNAALVAVRREARATAREVRHDAGSSAATRAINVAPWYDAAATERARIEVASLAP